MKYTLQNDELYVSAESQKGKLWLYPKGPKCGGLGQLQIKLSLAGVLCLVLPVVRTNHGGPEVSGGADGERNWSA